MVAVYSWISEKGVLLHVPNYISSKEKNYLAIII